jgi:hypothetical protein
VTAELAAYQRALDAVAATARSVAGEQLGVALPPVCVAIRLVAPGGEALWTDYVDTVTLTLSDLAQLRPPPAGSNPIYGVCHEIAHMIVARAAPGGRDLPVVWDEALAHLLAVDVLLPAVWAAHGDRLWPDPYPDYLERETQLPTGPATHFHGYTASLRRLTAELRALTAGVGVAGLLAALGALTPGQLRVEALGAALRRACAAPPQSS